MSYMNELEILRHQRLNSILNDYMLEELYLPWLKNPGNKNPYHNNDHQLIVALTAYDLGRSAGFRFPEKHKIGLLLAGMFHDFDHTGDPEITDSVNIERALEGWRKTRLEWGTQVLASPELSEVVETLIQATHADFSLDMNDLTLRYACEIIREADYGYLNEPDRDLWFKRLSDETRQEITLESTREHLKGKTFRYMRVEL